MIDLSSPDGVFFCQQLGEKEVDNDHHHCVSVAHVMTSYAIGALRKLSATFKTGQLPVAVYV